MFLAPKITFSPDKFGFYTVGDRKTFSKIEALQWQQQTKLFPEWDFNRKIFDSIEWAKEPDISLEELYRMRARQIRENYDHVVIMYSGGSDSHNILSYWIDAGLKIDEIACYVNNQGSNNKEDLQNSEIFKVVLPHIESLKKRGIEFNFRIIDQSQMEIDAMTVTDAEYSLNHNFSPIHLAKNLFRDNVREWSDMISNGKKLCLVWGCDKPQIFHDGDKLYLQFYDFIDSCLGPEIQRRYHQGWYDEFFYWTPDFPEIVQKQAAIVARFLRTVDDPKYYQKKSSRNGYNHKINCYLTDNALKCLLYPRWDTRTFSAGKLNVQAGRRFFSLRSKWLWESNLGEAHRFLQIGKSMFEGIDDYWKNQPGDVFKGLKCHASPRYYL